MRKSAKCVKKARLAAGQPVEPVRVAEEQKKPLKPAQCRAHMRRVLAMEFHGIVAGFVEGAKSGSCQHVKLATELLEPKRRATKPRRKSSTVDRWVEEMERGA